MSVLHAEVYEAFRVLDVPDDKALRAAVALSAALASFEDDTVKGFDKRDADIEAIREDISSMKGEIADINTRLATFQGAMEVRFTSIEARFDKRMTSVENGFDKKIASVEDGLGKRIASVEDSLGKRITAFQADFDRRIVALQGDLNTRMASVQGETNLLKWMMGTVIALLVTVLFRIFTH